MKRYHLRSETLSNMLNKLGSRHCFEAALNKAAQDRYDQISDDSLITVEFQIKTDPPSQYPITMQIDVPKRKIVCWEDGLNWFDAQDLHATYPALVYVELADGLHHFAESNGFGRYLTLDDQEREIELTNVTRFAFCHWAWFARKGFPTKLNISEQELKQLKALSEKLHKKYIWRDVIFNIRQAIHVEEKRLKDQALKTHSHE